MQSWGCSRCFRVRAYLKHLFLNWEWSQCAQPYSASLHMKNKTHRATFYFKSLSHYNLHFKGQGEEKGSYDNYIFSPMVYYLLYISVGNLIPWSKKKKKVLGKRETRWFSQLCDAMGNRQQKRQLIGMMSSTQKHWNHFVTKRHNPINYGKNNFYPLHVIVINGLHLFIESGYCIVISLSLFLYLSISLQIDRGIF